MSSLPWEILSPFNFWGLHLVALPGLVVLVRYLRIARDVVENDWTPDHVRILLRRLVVVWGSPDPPPIPTVPLYRLPEHPEPEIGEDNRVSLAEFVNGAGLLHLLDYVGSPRWATGFFVFFTGFAALTLKLQSGSREELSAPVWSALVVGLLLFYWVVGIWTGALRRRLRRLSALARRGRPDALAGTAS